MADNPAFPFCSRSCKLVDLGQWLTGGYRLPGPSVDLDDEAIIEAEGERPPASEEDE